LPGLGEYTAGAVASIAFGEVVPAADGNVRRVLSRLFDVRDPKPAWVRASAAELVDLDRPGDWNQAMMDLGATLCLPRAPHCHSCPVSSWCAARANGTHGERPGPTNRRAPRLATIALAVLHADGRVLLVRRPTAGLLGGMWAFPEREVGEPEEALDAACAVASEAGFEVIGAAAPLPMCDHKFTHLHARYVPYAVEVVGPPAATRSNADAAWIDARQPTHLALPVAQQRVLESFRALTPAGVA
jgi:A/G-specific adenine glycosylase